MDGFYTDHLRADPSSDFGFVLADAKLIETLGPAYGEFDAALDLIEPMRLGHLTSPYLQWSYYFSQGRQFVVIYPGATAAETLATSVAAGGRDVRTLLASWNEYDLFKLGTPRADPERKPYWTGVYVDAAGAGRMVTHAAPIYRQDRFLGIVATDITLGMFAQLLQHLAQTLGTVAIANAQGQVLAARNAVTGDTSAPEGLSSLLPPELATRPTAEVLAPSEDFRRIDGAYILARRAAAEPFWLIHFVSEAELLRQLLPRFALVGLILLSLLVTLAVAIILLGRHLVRPGLMLVRHIQAEAQDEAPPAAPVPPAMWRPWFDAVSRAFASVRLYQKRLEASEAEYRAVVETQTEFVVRFLPDNRVLFANEAYCRHIGIPGRCCSAHSPTSMSGSSRRTSSGCAGTSRPSRRSGRQAGRSCASPCRAAASGTRNGPTPGSSTTRKAGRDPGGRPRPDRAEGHGPGLGAPARGAAPEREAGGARFHARRRGA